MRGGGRIGCIGSTAEGGGLCTGTWGGTAGGGTAGEGTAGEGTGLAVACRERRIEEGAEEVVAAAGREHHKEERWNHRVHRSPSEAGVVGGSWWNR